MAAPTTGLIANPTTTQGQTALAKALQEFSSKDFHSGAKSAIEFKYKLLLAEGVVPTNGKAVGAISPRAAQETTHSDQTAGNQPALTSDECFDRLQTKAAKHHLRLYRQSCLDPEFGTVVFTISSPKVMVTFDSLPQVDAWLSARPNPI